MCGITGFIDHNHSISETDLKNASATLTHLGDYGTGIIFDQKDHYTLGLANARQPTIDLSEKAAQPLTSNCGNYTITINGTIYNYLELRESLIKYGVIFSTLSDTEVVLECYKKWGNKAFELLDGSYSFALVDRKLSLLLIARDDLGAKPLYYIKQKGFYAYSSEIRALLALPPVHKSINKNAMSTFFRYGYFIEEETIYKDIYRFKKGNLTTIDLHSGNSYDSPLVKFKLKPDNNSTETEEQVLARIEELLTESILKRNVGKVPIAVLLSGGYDSSTVAAILQKNQSKRIKTYTIGFKDSKLDEASRAKNIAAYLKTNHKEFYLDKEKALTIVKNLSSIFDEPIGDSSAIPLAFIANEVRAEVKVLLGSEGGDEMFGGYRTYAKALKLNGLLNTNLPKIIKQTILGFLKYTQPQMKEAIEADSLLNKYLAINACFTTNQINVLLNSDYNFEKKPKKQASSIKDLLIYDLHHYLPNNILVRNDKCFRYYGVENRDALLKTDLIDYLSTLDPELFLKNGQQKYLLKKITYKYIPESLMHDPKKGFVIPLASWLKTSFKPLVETYLAPARLKEHNLLNVSEVQKIKAAFYSNSSTYNAQKVWLILQFQMWYEKWFSQD
ncbi:asparagine synthase (glutamine-hydrolyzing) [Pedobacter polaris]|uniref:asparagine synthase (glutamine-hydrolyzing) n=1 Tax=Pedobacter polaris TaxID=2571273 RepID=A0A4U1CID3_9SPHI|nr:asparagine synthase (glutamine-hydrolyzing) [Pedobacter polaris]TKC06627.1 asparagine synthase (glutamine-hydrolyzing) [Pedobacter polaris]